MEVLSSETELSRLGVREEVACKVFFLELRSIQCAGFTAQQAKQKGDVARQ